MTQPPPEPDEAAPAVPPEEPAWLDEDELDADGLDALPRPAPQTPVAPATPVPPPLDEEDGQEPADDPLAGLDRASSPPDEEDDLVQDESSRDLPDETQLSPAWLDTDGLIHDGDQDEENLEMRPAGDSGPVLAGAEEYVVLVDLGGVVVPATLATGMTGSVLSAPLSQRDGDKVRMRLGPEIVEADPRGLATRVRLGHRILPVTLRLVEGPSPRLVLGRDVLAGQVVVDPDARFLLDRSKVAQPAPRPDPLAADSADSDDS